MNALRWSRVFGDTMFAAGAVTFVIAVLKVTIGSRAAKTTASTESAIAAG